MWQNEILEQFQSEKEKILTWLTKQRDPTVSKETAEELYRNMGSDEKNAELEKIRQREADTCIICHRYHLKEPSEEKKNAQNKVNLAWAHSINNAILFRFFSKF